MNDKLRYIVARLGERSTWNGIAALMVAAGVTVQPNLWSHIVAAGIAFAGLMNAVLPEAPAAAK